MPFDHIHKLCTQTTHPGSCPSSSSPGSRRLARGGLLRRGVGTLLQLHVLGQVGLLHAGCVHGPHHALPSYTRVHPCCRHAARQQLHLRHVHTRQLLLTQCTCAQQPQQHTMHAAVSGPALLGAPSPSSVLHAYSMLSASNFRATQGQPAYLPQPVHRTPQASPCCQAPHHQPPAAAAAARCWPWAADRPGPQPSAPARQASWPCPAWGLHPASGSQPCAAPAQAEEVGTTASSRHRLQ